MMWREELRENTVSWRTAMTQLGRGRIKTAQPDWGTPKTGQSNVRSRKSTNHIEVSQKRTRSVCSLGRLVRKAGWKFTSWVFLTEEDPFGGSNDIPSTVKRVIWKKQVCMCMFVLESRIRKNISRWRSQGSRKHLLVRGSEVKKTSLSHRFRGKKRWLHIGLEVKKNRVRRIQKWKKFETYLKSTNQIDAFKKVVSQVPSFGWLCRKSGCNFANLVLLRKEA